MSKNQQRKRFWKKRMHLPTEDVSSMGGCVIEAVLWALAIAALLMALSRSAGGAEVALKDVPQIQTGPQISFSEQSTKHEEQGTDWALICLWGVMLATPVVVWLAVRRQRKNEVELAEAYAGEEVCCSRFSVSGGRVTPSSFPEPPPVKSFTEFPRGVDWTRGALTNAWDDPLATEPDTLKREQLTCEAPRILGAVAEELRLIREMVRAARRSRSVEDYGDALAGSEERLGQLRVTVTELAARLGEDQFNDDGGELGEVPQIQTGPPRLLVSKSFSNGEANGCA